jgi:hypothetical protein
MGAAFLAHDPAYESRSHLYWESIMQMAKALAARDGSSKPATVAIYDATTIFIRS